MPDSNYRAVIAVKDKKKVAFLFVVVAVKFRKLKIWSWAGIQWHDIYTRFCDTVK
jgi:hypothetical protein